MIILESVNLWPARTERLWSESSLISRCHPDFLLPKSMERALTWWRRPWLLEVGSETSCGASVCRKQCKTLLNKESADGVTVNDSYQFHSNVSDLTHGAVIWNAWIPSLVLWNTRAKPNKYKQWLTWTRSCVTYVLSFRISAAFSTVRIPK